MADPDDPTADAAESPHGRVEAGPRPSPAPSEALVAEARRPRVLIADDEPRIRFALRACLEAEGYRVEEAADGDDALGLVIQFAPDLMILDLAMPKLDGIRTLRALEGVHGQLKPKVIVLTAWSSPPAILRTIGLGASVFLEKPVLPDDLRRVVAKVLNEPPGPTGSGPAASYESQEGVPIDWDAWFQ